VKGYQSGMLLSDAPLFPYGIVEELLKIRPELGCHFLEAALRTRSVGIAYGTARTDRQHEVG
jgi:hypothetical protein